MNEFKNQISFFEMPELLPEQIPVTKTTACFTGHRNIKKEIYPRLKEVIKTKLEELYNAGIRRFIVGGAVGFDTIVTLEILKMKKRNKDISVILVIPCLNQEKYYTEEEKKEYYIQKRLADFIIQNNKPYYDGCMLERNRFMVNSSDICVAYYLPKLSKTTGTAYTVHYAQERNKEVINLANQI